jgi:pyrimidine precursor biosynthesis enzyme
LTKYYGMSASDYTAVRCGMNVSKAIIEGKIDAGIGLENVQQVEVRIRSLWPLWRVSLAYQVYFHQLEEWCKQNGRPASDVKMLRIDELAELGCCCFCSILYIVSIPFLSHLLYGLVRLFACSCRVTRVSVVVFDGNFLSTHWLVLGTS